MKASCGWDACRLLACPPPARQGFESAMRFRAMFRAGGARMQSLPMIAVQDVGTTVRWYSQLLNCHTDHVSDDFARLRSGDRILLLVHDWAADEHGAWEKDRGIRPGNGFVLWFIVGDFAAVYRRATALGAEILLEPHENAEDHVREFTLRDADGYAVSIIEE